MTPREPHIGRGAAGNVERLAAIPTRWREELRGRELFEPLLARLVARVKGD